MNPANYDIYKVWLDIFWHFFFIKLEMHNLLTNTFYQKLGEMEKNKEKDVDYLSSIEVLLLIKCILV